MSEPLPTLTDWGIANEPDDSLIWGKGMWDQVMFFRDELRYLLFDNYEASKEYPGIVVSTHTSKSVKLPVARIENDWLRLTLRANFYNYIVSVDSDHTFYCDFGDLVRWDETINPIYAEGFHKDWVYGPYRENGNRFTVSLPSKYAVWTFVWILTRQGGPQYGTKH